MPELSSPTIKSRLSSLKKIGKKKKKNEGPRPPATLTLGTLPGVRSGVGGGNNMIFQLSYRHDGEKRKRGAAVRRI